MEYEMRRLQTEATEEAARVMLARAYAADTLPHDEGCGPLVTRARHRDTRRRLGGRCLLVYRVSCNDSSGRAVAARLVGMLMALAADTEFLPPRDRIRAALARADAMIRPHVHHTSSKWMRDTEHFAAAFRRARLRRERAIHQQSHQRKPQLFQAGLFDRRAERDAMNQSAALADREQAMRTRIREAECSRVVESVTDLLLVLTP